MRYLILGPLEVRDGDESVPVGGRQQRKLLAILLLHMGEVVSSDRLIDELWGSRPPGTAVKALQGYISQLRKRLGPATLETVGSGYRLRVEPEELDAGEFERLLADARRLEREAAAMKLREALGLWRGPALAEFAYDDFAQREVERLEGLRHSCIERKIDLELALGYHDDLVPELEALVREHPLHERFRRHLMVALYRSGRQVEALDAYREAHAALREDLGLEPGDELQVLQRSILAHDDSLTPPQRVELPDGQRPQSARKASRLRRPVVAIALGVVLLAAATVVAVSQLTARGARSIVVPPNSVAKLDSHGSRVTSYAEVGTDPAAVAVGAGGVWVTNSGDGTVGRLDTHTGRPVRTLGIGAHVGGVAVGFGSVWVAGGKDGTVTRIDATRNTIERTITVGPGPVGFIAIDARHVWVTRGDQLLRIDPATNLVDGRLTIGTPSGLAAGAGAVWVITGSKRLVRIDAGTAKATATRMLRAKALAPLYARGGLWFVNNGRIDKADPRSLATISTVDGVRGALALAAGGGYLWAVDGRGDLVRIDARGRATTLHVGPSLSAVTTGAGATWVTVTRPA
jgi:DNA-binding SARP family transcriptional activator/streptogramin lyase